MIFQMDKLKTDIWTIKKEEKLIGKFLVGSRRIE